MSQTAFLAVNPVLPAADVLKAVAFYKDKLGFEPVFEHGEPVSYAGVRRGPLVIHLCRMDDAVAIAAQTMLRIQVQNIEPLYEEYSACGVVHPNGALQTKPWGTREFTVLDLTGVCISFYENAS